MLTEYTWDAQAAKGIKDQKLDEHFARNLDFYLEIARPVWIILHDHNKYPFYLKHDDLYAPLVPIFERTSLLQDTLGGQGLPRAGERGSSKWLCWFTHYVVEQCLTISEAGGEALAELKFKDEGKIKGGVATEIKTKKELEKEARADYRSKAKKKSKKS